MTHIRTPNVPWQVSWAGGQWNIAPGTRVRVIKRNLAWGAAKVEFPNPSPIARPEVIFAIVPWNDLESHTSLVAG